MLLNQALTEGKSVIPLLVDGARMPNAIDLPDGSQDLAYQEALNLESELELPGVIARILTCPREPSSLLSKPGKKIRVKA
jgi:hypothetical protein